MGLLNINTGFARIVFLQLNLLCSQAYFHQAPGKKSDRTCIWYAANDVHIGVVDATTWVKLGNTNRRATFPQAIEMAKTKAKTRTRPNTFTDGGFSFTLSWSGHVEIAIPEQIQQHSWWHAVTKIGYLKLYW